MRMRELGLPSRFEPAVKNFLHALQYSLAHFRRDGKMIDMFAMDVRESSSASQLFEFGDGTDADNLSPD
jgi:hypothetical protein